ncbi:MAG TPA: S1/P1 nuclease [Vicinamibacterales bacterium]|nr:S1/P1 nuclease [Vicinamibacterales bacterium]
MFRRPALVLAAVVVAFVFALPQAVVPVSAWGVMGHRVVARLAWALTTPAVREQVALLFEVGQEPGRELRTHEAFVAAATWADEVRSARPETYNWHFVDIPVGETRYEAARDCPPTEKGDCAIAEIARARAELVDVARPLAQRAEALKFLIHIVGDLHQPLHAIDNHDRGGNDVRVAALRGEDGRATNLHAVWDTGLINLSTETESSRADRLFAQFQAQTQSQPFDVTLDAVRWAEESHDVGVRVVYRYPSFVPTGPGLDQIVLDDAYRASAIAEIDRRQQLAGVRLATLLIALLK